VGNHLTQLLKPIAAGCDELAIDSRPQGNHPSAVASYLDVIVCELLSEKLVRINLKLIAEFKIPEAAL
jgi:hypothetical protein